MKKIIVSTFLILSLYGCLSMTEEVENRFEAGRQDERAEIERRKGNETMAEIHEDSARRNRNATSFLPFVIEKIFD